MVVKVSRNCCTVGAERISFSDKVVECSCRPCAVRGILRCRKGCCIYNAKERALMGGGASGSGCCLLALTTVTRRVGRQGTRQGARMVLTIKLPLSDFKERGRKFERCLLQGRRPIQFLCRDRLCRVAVGSIGLFPRKCSTLTLRPRCLGGRPSILLISVNN